MVSWQGKELSIGRVRVSPRPSETCEHNEFAKAFKNSWFLREIGPQVSTRAGPVLEISTRDLWIGRKRTK